MTTVDFEKTKIDIVISNPRLATSIARALRRSISEFPAPPRYPCVKVRTFRRLEVIDPRDHIAIVKVTAPGLRRPFGRRA